MVILGVQNIQKNSKILKRQTEIVNSALRPWQTKKETKDKHSTLTTTMKTKAKITPTLQTRVISDAAKGLATSHTDNYRRESKCQCAEIQTGLQVTGLEWYMRYEKNIEC